MDFRPAANGFMATKKQRPFFVSHMSLFVE